LRLKFTWLAGNLQRIHAGTNEIDDSAEVEIGADDVTELFAEWLGGRICGAEIGYGDAVFCGAHVGASGEPCGLLGLLGGGLGLGEGCAGEEDCCAEN
jgi:hypothetical protein